MALKYTTISEFLRRYGLLDSTRYFQLGQDPVREVIGNEIVTAKTYYLDHLGVIEDSLVLYVGNTSTELTLTTHYTFDATTSEITITSDGVTALGSSDLTAHYDWCVLGKELMDADIDALLTTAENEFEEDTEMAFSTLASPQYNQYTNETYEFKTQTVRRKDSINLKHSPIVNLQTTVASNYTTGGASLVLTDGTGFPSSGTIYIGGNKVAYTAKSTNTLTVPTSTPSIDAGETVRGEVVEISLESEGNVPSWTVLTYGEQYEVYPDTGYIKLLTTSFYNILTQATITVYNQNVNVRTSYMQAWHDAGEDPTIPSQVVNCIYMIAASLLAKRGVRSAQIGKINFDPAALNVDQTMIDKIKMDYSTSNIHIR